MAAPSDMPRSIGSQAFGALLLAVALAVGYLVTGQQPALRTLENQTLDWRFKVRGAMAPGPETVLLMIDDRTIAKLGVWPLSRSHLAAAVRALAADGARVVALDLLLLGGRGTVSEDADRLLAKAIAEAGSVVVPFGFSSGPASANVAGIPDSVARSAYRVFRLPEGERPRLAFMPGGLLAPAPVIAAAAATAHTGVLLEPDGALRYEHPVVGFGEAYFPSLSVEVARLYLRLDRDEVMVNFVEGIAIGDRDLPTDEAMRWPVNYYGPEGTFETFSLVALIEGRLPPGTFKDKIVLVGTAALGIGDAFNTPFSQLLPGAEYTATVIDNILHGRFLTRNALTAALDLLAILAGSLAAAGLAALAPPLVAGLATVALLLAWALATQLTFQEAGFWLSLFFPLAATLFSYSCFTVLRTLGEGRGRGRAERQRGNLARYLPGALAGNLAESGDHHASERTEDLAVMFVDMVGFTHLTEDMAPADTIALLRAYHGRVERAVLAHGGVIDKFIGDGVMASFGLPEPGPANARSALLAARAMVEDIAAWSDELAAAGRPRVAIGVGLHYGPVLAGTLGGEHQMTFTLTGDTVNIASRLEALTRDQGAAVIASDALVEAARRTEVAGSPGGQAVLEGFAALPPQTIRGRSRPIGLWAWPGTAT